MLSIGEFSRATHLSVKALRHYHDVGVLEPVDVDATTGYRYYAIAQVPLAHVIRRLRDLDMPLDDVKAVLTAPDVTTRDRALLNHLVRMEAQLEQTQSTVSSLRALLEGSLADGLEVEFRSVDTVRAIAIRESVSWSETEAWLSAALLELRDMVKALDIERAGPDGALYTNEYFEAHAGDVVAYLPVAGSVDAGHRIRMIEIPGARLAVVLHRGGFDDLDETYGALGAFVAERAIGAAGPVREHYLVSVNDTETPDAWQTEVCWPVTP